MQLQQSSSFLPERPSAACDFGYLACVKGANAQWAGVVSDVCAWLVFSYCLLDSVQ